MRTQSLQGTERAVLRLRLGASPSGPPVDVPLRYVRSEQGFHVMARGYPRPRWAEAALAAPLAHWTVGSQEYVGRVLRIEDPVDRSTLVEGRFDAEFGKALVDAWFGDVRIAFTLIPGHGTARDDFRDLEAYFDQLAEDYDAQVLGNPLDRWLRTVSVEILTSAFRPGQRVLEIGCGTGLETLPLARMGIDVVAVDASSRMLSILRAKAEREGLAARITAIHESTGGLERIVDTFGSCSFDGAFSTFGALNCEPDLSRVSAALGRLVRPEGAVILGVWNRFCAFEFLGYLLRGRWRRAYARFQDPVPVGWSRFGLAVRAYNVHDVAEAFAPRFQIRNVVGLPVLLPPYDFQGRLSPHGRILSILEGLDGALRDRVPFNRLGDHFVTELRRRP